MSQQPIPTSRYGIDDQSRRMSMSSIGGNSTATPSHIGGGNYSSAAAPLYSSVSPINNNESSPPPPSSSSHRTATAPHPLAMNTLGIANLCGVEIDPFSQQNQQPIIPCGVATPHAKNSRSSTRNGHGGFGEGSSSFGAGGDSAAHSTAGAAANGLMTLRQSMAALGNDQPGRLGSTMAAMAQLNTIQSQTINYADLGGGGVSPAAAAAAAGGRYGNMMSSPQSDASTSSTSQSPQQALAAAGSSAAGGPLDYDVEPFMLPSTPKGVSCLVFSLLSNWGDAYYVGLSGIEIFDGKGRRIVPSSSSSSTKSSKSSSSRPTFTIHSTFDVIARLGSKFGGLDLRASCIAGASNLSNVTQLVNGNYKKKTTDANEMFRMPVNFGEAIGLGDISSSSVGIGGFNPASVAGGGGSNNNALIWINFSAPVEISLIRIYNYNVGREQAFKGVQLMEILSVGGQQQQQQQSQQELIFRGEIAMASGDRFNEPEQILFVSPTAADVLGRIVEEDAKAAEGLEEKDPMMRLVYDDRTAQAASAVMNGGGDQSSGSSTNLSRVGSARRLGGTAAPVRCPSPPPQHPPSQSGLGPLVGTSFHQKQTLNRVGSASSSRGGSSGSGAGGHTTVVQSIVGVPAPSSARGGASGGDGNREHGSPRTGRIASASVANSILRSHVANAQQHQLHNNNHNQNNGGGGGKTVSFASAGLSDAASLGKGRHPAAQDPSSCPKNVVAVCVGIQSTWGDPHFVGLSGIRFFTATGDLIFNVGQIQIARPPMAMTGLSATEHAALSSFDNEVAAIADGDATTACVWRFQDQMQLRVRFDSPVPSLGFIEIANYGISGSTQCGVKAAQIFVATTAMGSSASSSNPNALFDQLWSSPSVPTSVLMLTSPDVPLIIRKSPNQLSLLKHQSFDLSSVDGAGGGGADSGGIRGAVTMTTSMTASMAARARTEMRRARMSLFDGPPPASALPHGLAVATSLLPQGYVLKLELGLAVVAPTASDLKPLLKSIINEGMNGGGNGSGGSSPTAAAVTIFDEECQPIPKELYNVAVTLKHEETSVVTANSGTSGVFSSHPSSSSESGPHHNNAMNDVTASIVIDRGFRETLFREQQEGLPQSPTATPPQERHLITLTFAFVFDIPTAISAISHNFKALQSAQGRITKKLASTGPATASATSVKVLVDDEPTYASLEFDLESVAAAMLSDDNDGVAAVEPPPRCVAFVWDPKLLSKF